MLAGKSLSDIEEQGRSYLEKALEPLCLRSLATDENYKSQEIFVQNEKSVDLLKLLSGEGKREEREKGVSLFFCDSPSFSVSIIEQSLPKKRSSTCLSAIFYLSSCDSHSFNEEEPLLLRRRSSSALFQFAN